jgi:formamidopyrimidine-DNA glycosylase
MTPEKFEVICNSRKSIKELLLDQSKIAGVGNIYAAEALWFAGIDPRRIANTLPPLGPRSRFELFLSIRSVLRQALERRLNYNGLKIYRRDVCPVCGGTVTAEDIKGRTTYWCPTCQV